MLNRRFALRMLLGVGLLAQGAQAPAETLAALPPPVAHAARALGVPESSISVWVQAVDEFEPRLAFNVHVPRNPASAMKLLTTFAALQQLGPAYRWRTEVYLQGPVERGRSRGDLWIRGHGDPFLVSEEVWRLARDLRTRGLERINGELVFDNSYFDLPAEDPGAFDGRPDRVYNLVPHPLLMNFNAVRFRVEPGRDDGTVRVHAEPPLPSLEVDNRLRLGNGPCTGFQRGVALTVRGAAAQRDRVTLEGQFPNGCREFEITRTVLHPDSYAYDLFGLYWSQLGGTRKGGWREGRVPETSTVPFHVHESRPLGDLLRPINKYSNNVMTRHLELTLGAERFGAPATPEKGERAILEILGEQGVDVRGLVIANSAGLSRHSRVSAHQVGEVLRAGWRSAYMPEYVSSLSVSGLDGTVRRRFNGGGAAGRMHLKTGTLDDVSSIAGYVNTYSGKRLMVVILINNPDAHRGPGEELQNLLLLWTLQQ